MATLEEIMGLVGDKNKIYVYHKAASELLAKEMRATGGDAGHLSALITCHCELLGKLVALTSLGDPEQVKGLLDLTSRAVADFATNSAPIAKEILERKRAEHERG